MAKYVVPPKSWPIIRCENCKTLYVPEKVDWTGYYESCPICKWNSNDGSARIPLWKYNIIKWFRGGFKDERTN